MDNFWDFLAHWKAFGVCAGDRQLWGKQPNGSFKIQDSILNAIWSFVKILWPLVLLLRQFLHKFTTLQQPTFTVIWLITKNTTPFTHVGLDAFQYTGASTIASACKIVQTTTTKIATQSSSVDDDDVRRFIAETTTTTPSDVVVGLTWSRRGHVWPQKHRQPRASMSSSVLLLRLEVSCRFPIDDRPSSVCKSYVTSLINHHLTTYIDHQSPGNVNKPYAYTCRWSTTGPRGDLNQPVASQSSRPSGRHHLPAASHRPRRRQRRRQHADGGGAKRAHLVTGGARCG